MHIQSIRWMTGDGRKWLIATKASIDGSYSGAKRMVVKSSLSATPCAWSVPSNARNFLLTISIADSATWFNRVGVARDPHISMSVFSFKDDIAFFILRNVITHSTVVIIQATLCKLCRCSSSVHSLEIFCNCTRYKGASDTFAPHMGLVLHNNGVNVFIRNYNICRECNICLLYFQP